MKALSHKISQFEYADDFRTFLPENGVPKGGKNYVSWMNRAARILGHSIGPADLSREEDAATFMRKLLDLDQGRRIKTSKDESDQLSTLRKYIQMVQTKVANTPTVPAPVANDIANDDITVRVPQIVHRIVRDTEISREIKLLYEFRCQVCEVRLEIKPGDYYAEAHHLQPLGGEHKGQDVKENLLCLCPNHHALFDYFALPLIVTNLKLNRHTIGQLFVDYHNTHTTKGGIS